jgi:hypothetical protein
VGSDKKRKGGRLRFIVPAAPGETQMLSLAEPEIARLVTAKG